MEAAGGIRRIEGRVVVARRVWIGRVQKAEWPPAVGHEHRVPCQRSPWDRPTAAGSRWAHCAGHRTSGRFRRSDISDLDLMGKGVG